MYSFTIILLFIVICEGEVKINIKIGSSKDNSSASFIGAHEVLASDNDVDLFNVTENRIKQGIEILLGKTPDDVFLRDPTSYNNLFRDYNWKELTRSTRVKNIEFVNVFNRNVILKTVNHINNTTIRIKAKVRLFETVETSVVSTWPKSAYPANFTYNISFLIGSQRFHLVKKWHKNITNYIWLNFGTTKKGFISIDPGHVVNEILSAKKTTLLLRINYVTSLTGCIAANYSHVYGKYHFWAPFIKDIMKAIKMNNEIISTEKLEIVCYTDPQLSIINSGTSGGTTKLLRQN